MSDKTEFIEEAKVIGDYEDETLDRLDFERLITRAQRHLKSKHSFEASSPNWFSNDLYNEALFWTTLLFSKVAVGELDSQDFTAGALKEGELLAKSDDDVTTWYRNYSDALNALNSDTRTRETTPSRTDADGERFYE